MMLRLAPPILAVMLALATFQASAQKPTLQPGDYIAAVVRQHHGRMGDAASALGIQRTNLYRKLRQLSVMRHGRESKG